MISSADKRFDVLGLGCAAVDDVIYVASFPAADRKVRVEQTTRQCGGLTGTALVTAARLGVRCGFAGCLGTDEFSRHVADNFASEGVDLAFAPRLPEAGVVHSIIVVGRDTGSRNIFYETNGLMGAHASLPGIEVFQDTEVLFIDHYGMVGNLRAARAARAAGVAVVADLEDKAGPWFDEVLGLVDLAVLSESFALRVTRKATAAEAALALWHSERAVVIVTCGREGCWSLSAEDRLTPRHHPAFAVNAVDTNGCGDVFHGAYAAALSQGEPLEDRIRFAAAAAALKAARTVIPRRAEVEQFLQSMGTVANGSGAVVAAKDPFT